MLTCTAHYYIILEKAEQAAIHDICILYIYIYTDQSLRNEQVENSISTKCVCFLRETLFILKSSLVALCVRTSFSVQLSADTKLMFV